MKSENNWIIAGKKKVRGWQKFRKTLVVGGDPRGWQRAFRDYFQARLDSRYLTPIRILQTQGTWEGEGFSILAIQCSLIEFFESTFEGKNYQYVRRMNELGSHEYKDSKEVFVRFLCERHPFNINFDENLAKEFYTKIRCGLLHEARTKGGWIVKADAPSGKGMIDGKQHIVYRNNFQKALEEYISWYGNVLPQEALLQKAFIRKFDSLCK